MRINIQSFFKLPVPSPPPPVGSGDSVEVGLLAIVDVCVRLPDLPQHLDTQGKGILDHDTDTESQCVDAQCSHCICS